jgi:LPXTG-motif cell wall-anchored protein
MSKRISLLLIAAFVWFGVSAAMPAHASKSAAMTAELRTLLSSQLGGRDAEFKAAADALDANSVALSKSIGSVYGTDAENAFLPLWRKHIGFFVDYTQGKATKDQAKQDKAVSDLTQYTQDFGAFLNSANPNLPKDTVADLVKTHVLTLKDVVDAQATDDYAKAYTAQRDAYAHMSMIADPLTNAIMQQFPEKFGGSAAGGAPTTGDMANMPMTMPNTGAETTMPYALIGLALMSMAGGLAVSFRYRRSA